MLDCTALTLHEKRIEALVHPQRLAELYNIRKTEALARSFGCDLLLSHFVRTHMPELPFPPRRAVEDRGKPYLADCPDVCFSLSHSGSWSVLAAADVPVGVDLEYIREPRSGLIGRVFHPDEAACLETVPEQARAAAFTELWTIKESVLKMTGDGLYKPMRSFTVKRGALQEQICGDGCCYALLPPPEPDCALAVCWRDTMSREILQRHLSVSELLTL